ncbi:unnamed protein product [Rhizophagus irregularis]|nr:unnamed protein product [Rhizophagus irregularis]
MGSGSFGSVVRANWKINLFTLKTLNHDKTKLKEIVNKVQLYSDIKLKIFLNLTDKITEKILRFYGITKM